MSNINLIIPCAGKSIQTKPKWLLSMPNGNLMIQECISCLDLENVGNIYLVFLKDDVDKYCKNTNINILFNIFKKKIFIYLLDDLTNSQCETIYKVINHFNIVGKIFIKDCDNSFDFKIKEGNYVLTLNLEKQKLDKISDKSYVQINNINEIINIVEKKIISNYICIGGYSFSDVKLFTESYEKINNLDKKIYVSHIIYYLILNNEIFNIINLDNYNDWGTYKLWRIYCDSFKTLFIDIDGTLVINSSQYFEPKWGTSNAIKKNVEHLRKLYKTQRVKIILTTARKKSFENQTIKQLKSLGIPYHKIIFDLYHCKRYLINDYSTTNPYPSAIAINLERNSNKLEYLL